LNTAGLSFEVGLIDANLAATFDLAKHCNRKIYLIFTSDFHTAILGDQAFLQISCVIAIGAEFACLVMADLPVSKADTAYLSPLTRVACFVSCDAAGRKKNKKNQNKGSSHESNFRKKMSRHRIITLSPILAECSRL
jgi:hypothetical protein